MIKVAICEDDNQAKEEFIKLLNKVISKNQLKARIVFSATTPSEFLKYTSLNSVDVIFLDIDLNAKKTGIDVARKIREVNKRVYIIFTTGHFEYTLISYKVIAFDYLIKPITFNSLNECVVRLSQHLAEVRPNIVTIRTAGTTHILPRSEIIYVEKIANKSYIYTKQQIVESNLTLEEIFEMLDPTFIRCHKSYIINISRIDHIDNSTNVVYMEGNHKCGLGRKYKKELMEVLAENGYDC